MSVLPLLLLYPGSMKNIPQEGESVKEKYQKQQCMVEQITKAVLYSPYTIHAAGCRDVDAAELYEIIKIILTAEPDDVIKQLGRLYKYHPATIELNRSSYEAQCQYYDRDKCECFLPGKTFKDCWRKQIQHSDKDIRNSGEYQEWRTAVFKRDGYTCQKCGQKGGELNAHHIKPFAEYKNLRFDVDNGITLCKKCHRKAHKKRR